MENIREDNINEQDTFGRTELHISASEGRVAAVKLLLEYGADHMLTDCFGDTPLMGAAENGHVDVIDVLHEAGKLQNINAQDNGGFTALHHAASKGHVEVVKRLLEYGADATAVTASGYTVEWLAVINGHVDVIDVLRAASQEVSTQQ